MLKSPLEGYQGDRCEKSFDKKITKNGNLPINLLDFLAVRLPTALELPEWGLLVTV
jgi:hypothetical protein